MANPAPSILAKSPAAASSSTAAESDAQLSALADTRRISRVGLLTLVFGFGGFIAWASLVPIDQGVSSVGQVSVDTKRKAVQHLKGGIVQQVLVKEGQWVQKDQPLILLDDAATKAGYESVRQQLYALQAVESRLLAEQQGGSKIDFNPALITAARADDKLNLQMKLESQLLQTRRQSLQASLDAIRETAMGHEAIIASSSQVQANLRMQASSLEGELRGVRDMVKEGYLPTSRQLEMERQITSVRSQIADSVATQIRARQAILELKQRELSTRADYRKEIEQQLAKLRPEIQALSEQFKAISEELGRVEIRAPVQGQVVALSAQTVGGVVSPGQKIMDIVPVNESLIVEARVDSQLIDRIALGTDVDLRFSGFANTPQLVVEGKILTISSDTVSDPANPQLPAFYLARVEVTSLGMKELGPRKLQPGMPVSVVFKTGKRTLMDYIIRPLTKRLSFSLKEE